MKIPYCPARSLKCRIVDSRERLFRVALAWCGDPMLADDLVQETLSAGLNKRSQLRDKARLFAWLYSILNNQWNSYLRSKKGNIALDEQLPSEARGPAEDCEQLDIVKRVRQAVATLPIIERQVITLVNLEEMSYAEVAMALDIPIGTVMSRLHRARKHLLERMEHHPQVVPTRKKNLYLVKK